MARARQTTSPKVWLITGSSAGLGLQLARAVRSRGDRVIATARRPESLAALQGDPDSATLQLDVTSSQEVLNAKVKEALALFGQIDVLVNNAGYILSGVWEQLSSESVLQQLETNLLGPLRLTKAVLPHLRQQGGGSLAFIGSVAGWVGAAAGGPYSASKFALEGAVECLQKEVAQFNIQTYIFELGQFRTSILDSDRRKYDASEETLPAYRDLMGALLERHANTDGKQRGDPLLAAERIVDVVNGDKRFDAARNISSPPTLRRVFLGPDCVKAVRTKCESTLQDIDRHHDFFCSTDFAERTQVIGYGS